MAKGSQLSQLKSALNNAGVIGNPPSGKKRKRATPQQNHKEKRDAKIEEIRQRLNPFDVKVTKLKHDVGGRKLKGMVGRPAESKMAGLEQRKKTLLKEYERKDRSGGIVDRRFGENDPTMDLEERMLERFTRERQKASKGSAFNLDDEDELTHYGQSLSKMDDFEDADLGLDEEDEEASGQMDPELVKNTHFGGFEDEDESEEPARKKSKAEVMAEVIAKSKEHKMLRQMESEQQENVVHELDQAFDSIRQLLQVSAPPPPVEPSLSFQPTVASMSGSNSIPLGRPANTDEIIASLQKGDDSYDQRVRELAFDKRAKPKDRTKTEEEVALEAKEALEKAERKRLRRMQGLSEDDSDNEGRGKGKRKRGGDDLDDDFEEPEDWAGIGEGLKEEEEDPEDQEGSSEDDDSDDESGEEHDSGSDSDEDGEIPSNMKGEHAPLTSTKTASATQPSNELPFTFPCPSSHEEFLEIVDGIDDNDVPVVIQRIRALYHPSLAEDNKFKLPILNSVLIDHILYLVSPPKPKVLSSLLPHLFALSEAYPIQSAQSFNEKLTLMHKNLKRGLSNGALDIESKTWPGLPELMLLRVIGVLWPTSDMNHSVVSPTRILMGAYLGLCRIRSSSDIASGLFICTLFLQFEKLSKRFIPEVINFLINCVLHIAPHSYKDVDSIPGSFPVPDFRSELCRRLILDGTKNVIMDTSRMDLFEALSTAEPTASTKAYLLRLSLSLLDKFADLYKGLDAFIELYGPVEEILQSIDSSRLPTQLQTALKSSVEMASRLLKFSRQSRRPLMLQSHKPIPIATYVPKFESSSSSYLRNRDPDYERNEASKLRNQYKQEKKGAIRELRKDARFLASVQQKAQVEKDRSYSERMRKVFGSIESERAEEKAMEKEKAKEKRRAGRK